MEMKEIINELKKLDNVEDAIKEAKERNINVDETTIEKLFNQYHSTSELGDDELDNVTGGCGDEEVVQVQHEYIDRKREACNEFVANASGRNKEQYFNKHGEIPWCGICKYIASEHVGDVWGDYCSK